MPVMGSAGCLALAAAGMAVAVVGAVEAGEREAVDLLMELDDVYPLHCCT